MGNVTILVDVPCVIEQLFHGVAITEPVEVGTPKVVVVLADGPMASDCFANEGVEVALVVRTTA